jgi:hypothetical protein
MTGRYCYRPVNMTLKLMRSEHGKVVSSFFRLQLRCCAQYRNFCFQFVQLLKTFLCNPCIPCTLQGLRESG